jgi:hypothetical protein
MGGWMYEAGVLDSLLLKAFDDRAPERWSSDCEDKEVVDRRLEVIDATEQRGSFRDGGRLIVVEEPADLPLLLVREDLEGISQDLVAETTRTYDHKPLRHTVSSGGD